MNHNPTRFLANYTLALMGLKRALFMEVLKNGLKIAILSSMMHNC